MIHALMFAAAVTSPATASIDVDSADVEAQAQAAADRLADEIERVAQVSEARLALCRRSTARPEVDRYPANVQEAVRRDPKIGPTTAVLEICQAYLHGRQDQLQEFLDQ